MPLGVWALEQACRQAVRWHEAAPDAPPLSMSVNLSPRQLAEPALPNDVARVLHDTGIQPSALWLEITESTLMRDAESALERARCAAGARPPPRGRRLRLRVLVAGVPRAVAGRGAEDRPLVHRGRRRSARTAPRSSTPSSSLARALHLSTVAEGIETREQFQQLRAMGCEVGQGFLFGPARPAEAFGADPASRLRAPVRAAPTPDVRSTRTA